MPRPILKTLSSYASPMRPSDSASKREREHVGVRQHVSASRRVSFSPFAKLREDSPIKSRSPLRTDEKETKGSLTSGFTFSSAIETEKKKQSRRKEELQTMQILYTAAKRRPHSMKSLVLTYVPGLKWLHTLAKEWMDYAKAMRNEIPWPRRSRPKRRPRRLFRSRWTDFDDADYKYVQYLTYSSTTAFSTLLPVSSRVCGYKPPIVAHRSLQPDLTPSSRGGFVSLLRKEGIPVDEDERETNRAIDEDLQWATRCLRWCFNHHLPPMDTRVATFSS
ncbi:hypothetical protein DD237_005167 [Peronospora effusa]|uniref:Uncharacterized protein n=1 Tax=Peronospora effusa TaxID=542832 RepID=A0A425C7B1_9STRA|nr:hypothetical protein DD237_005167 [Peronospora effusa]